MSAGGGGRVEGESGKGRGGRGKIALLALSSLRVTDERKRTAEVESPPRFVIRWREEV